jgi:hypothetical protein
MEEPIDDDILLRELYPDLSDEERIEVKEFLNAYCAIILRICEREERERLGYFDAPPLNP